MTSTTPAPIPAPGASAPASPVARWRAIAYALGVNAVVWSAVVGLHAASVWSDGLRRGRTIGLSVVFGDFALAYAPWVPFGAALYLLQVRRSAWQRVLALSVVFLLLELVYQAAHPLRGPDLTLANVMAATRDMPAVFRLIDVALLIATNAVVYAIVALRLQRDAREQESRLQADNLRLRLALEEQRLQGLRAQLEPHFLFNALNAISGLVRNDDRRIALTALQQLSRLLRYATTAVVRERVALSDEVTFVDEYLALQALRFGPRLQVAWTGRDAVPNDQECPPLLLQPLVENAVRHGLEPSDGPITIAVGFATTTEGTVITVTNTVPDQAPENRGLGVGLRALRNRLAAAYGGATLVTESGDGCFHVRLTLPRAPDD
ncbi:MAG: histidine kinase [Gemmatimonadetes bacterium]|nr:histidine kinase [Gemmatimonadota bacterium]